jgi:hypothetical protein
MTQLLHNNCLSFRLLKCGESHMTYLARNTVNLVQYSCCVGSRDGTKRGGFIDTAMGVLAHMVARSIFPFICGSLAEVWD